MYETLSSFINHEHNSITILTIKDYIMLVMLNIKDKINIS